MKIQIIGIVSGLAILGACSNDDPPDGVAAGGEVVATIDGRPISEAMLSFYARTRAQKEVEDLTPEENEQILDELVQLVLLANAAESNGLARDPEFAAELELMRLQTVARREITAELERSPTSDAELQQAYEDNLEALAGVQYKARHILVENESEAREIIGALEQGGDFQELARLRSTGPSGPSGGDLGWFSADRMVPPFATAVRNMEVGSYTSEPVQTRFGWHVILLEEKSDARAPDLDAVRSEVATMAEQQKVEAYLEQLRNSAQISFSAR